MLSIVLQLLAASATVLQDEPKISLDYMEGEFILRSAGKTDRVALKPVPEPPLPAWPPKRLLFRKDAAFVSWDARGISIRQKDWVYHTFLPQVSTSPRLFSREEILKTNELIALGQRSAQSARLSGAYRDGNDVFLLAGWEEKSGRPWLEALLKVDLTEPNPKPKLLGKFEGLSLNLRPEKSALFPRDGKPSAWIKTDDSWGLGSFDPASDVFEFKRLGERLETVELTSGRIGWFVERTAYPSRILYRWDSASLAKRELLETRGTARLMSPVEPWIAVVKEEEGVFLQNVESGARLRVPRNPGFRWSAFGVLVWSPSVAPAEATLYDPSRWTPLARWPLPPSLGASTWRVASSLP